MRALQTVLQKETWRIALNKYGAATGTTVSVYAVPGTLVLGPVNPTPLFETVNVGRPTPAMFTDCIQQCLTTKDTPIVVEDHGVAVIGTRLAVGEETLGVLVVCTVESDSAMQYHAACPKQRQSLSCWKLPFEKNWSLALVPARCARKMFGVHA